LRAPVDDRLIASADLRVEDVPGIDAQWDEVREFALTFNGYDHARSFESCAELARRTRLAYEQNSSLKAPLDDLRASLFFEQRREHWTDCVFAGDELRYIRALLAAIAERLEGR
jgi:hypothetical protein